MVSAKKTSCSGPHACHDCHGCRGPETCLGTTEAEHELITEQTRLYCLLLDSGLTHEQIRVGAHKGFYDESDLINII